MELESHIRSQSSGPVKGVTTAPVVIKAFSNISSEDVALMKEFVGFHWEHYKHDPQFVPLLDYEYLGSAALMVTGFLEGRNLFFKHAENCFFLAYRDGKIVGRCNAYINHHHNQHWKDKVGFLGHFESINDESVARELVEHAENWLRAKGMDTIRGPQNFPVNEATPGVMVEGFDTRTVVYYHYNKPYYAELLKSLGYSPIMNYLSYELSFKNDSVQETLEKISHRIIERYNITFETWGQRSYKERKREMLEVYNDAWNDNFGYVPFTEAEFNKVMDDTRIVMNYKLFLFVYINGKLASFMGCVPNISEILECNKAKRPPEFLRATILATMGFRIKGFRLGYLGVKKQFRGMGLDGLMIWKQVQVAKKLGYEYVDVGWVLETNKPVIRLVQKCGAKFSKKYTLFEKKLVTRGH